MSGYSSNNKTQLEILEEKFEDLLGKEVLESIENITQVQDLAAQDPHLEIMMMLDKHFFSDFVRYILERDYVIEEPEFEGFLNQNSAFNKRLK